MVINELLAKTDIFQHNNIMLENDTIVSLPTGYSSEKDDQSVLKLSDMRKTRITLGQLNKLRMLNDVRKIEFDMKIKKVNKQYKPAASEGGLL